VNVLRSAVLLALSVPSAAFAQVTATEKRDEAKPTETITWWARAA